MPFPVDKVYAIKWAEETGWATLFAVGGFAATWFLTTDITKVTDWKSVLVAAAFGCGRVVFAVLGNQIRQFFGLGESPPPAPTPTP